MNSSTIYYLRIVLRDTRLGSSLTIAETLRGLIEGK